MENHIVIDPPVRGQWAIMNPPGHPSLAFDFLSVNDKKRPYQTRYLLPHLFYHIPVGSTYAWSQPVYAPFDGTVVACSDGNPDHEKLSLIKDLVMTFVFRPKPGAPFTAFGGNHIILKSGKIYALLAHLRNGFVRVRPGASVHAGEQLAAVGNSGASIQPHLHFQVMAGEDPFLSELLPFKFRAIQKKVGSNWVDTTNASVKNGDHFRCF